MAQLVSGDFRKVRHLVAYSQWRLNAASNPDSALNSKRPGVTKRSATDPKQTFDNCGNCLSVCSWPSTDFGTWNQPFRHRPDVVRTVSHVHSAEATALVSKEEHVDFFKEVRREG